MSKITKEGCKKGLQKRLSKMILFPDHFPIEKEAVNMVPLGYILVIIGGIIVMVKVFS